MGDHVEANEEGEGQDAPVQGEPRQAPQHGPLTYLVEFVVGGPAAPWADLGLHVTSGVAVVGSVRLRVDEAASPGLRSVGLLETSLDDLDGAPVHPAEPSEQASASQHALRAVAFDHVVLMTPDLDRTCAAATAGLGVPLKRVREAAEVRQGFFRLGEVILEVVCSPRVPDGPARWWGLVINVEDVHEACDRLGPSAVGLPRPAVQPGRFIATVRDSFGLGVPMALMST